MKKLLNKKGFTLMEMLIVVAIIVILIAISIPVFSSSLDSVKKTADAANLRAAKGAYIVQSLAGADDPIESGKTYYYDVEQGKFVELADGASAPAASLGQCSKHKSAYITINASTNKVEWSDASTDCDN